MRRAGLPATGLTRCARAQVVTLLLHQQSVLEALAQFRTHIGWLRSPPASPPQPPAAAAAHALWLQRQYAVMGELLATRVDAGVLPDQARGLAPPPTSPTQCGHRCRALGAQRRRMSTRCDACSGAGGRAAVVLPPGRGACGH